MAESAKILSPEKKVLLPNMSAGCWLADSITPENLDDWKARYPDHEVVTYVNSTAEVKAESDICCTSANAVSVVRSLETDKVLFTPDRNLGRWVAEQVPEKDIVIYDGAFPTHDVLSAARVERTRGEFPESVCPSRMSSGRSGNRGRSVLDYGYARRGRKISRDEDVYYRHGKRDVASA